MSRAPAGERREALSDMKRYPKKISGMVLRQPEFFALLEFSFFVAYVFAKRENRIEMKT